MGENDWLEAFAHHPRIGGKDALRAKFAATKSWAQGEQAAVAAADEATLDALAKGNADYEASSASSSSSARRARPPPRCWRS